LHRVESLIDVLHACLGQSKSVIILSVDIRTELKELAKTTHLLRKSLGPTSQIIIREKGLAITPEQKQLFMYCGANAIISKDTEISQYATFLNAIRNQIYAKEIEPHFESIFARLPVSQHFQMQSSEPSFGNQIEPAKRSSSFSYKPSRTIQPNDNTIVKKAIEKAKRSSLSAFS
jgi:Cellulose biosynthesis GIL